MHKTWTVEDRSWPWARGQLAGHGWPSSTMASGWPAGIRFLVSFGSFWPAFGRLWVVLAGFGWFELFFCWLLIGLGWFLAGLGLVLVGFWPILVNFVGFWAGFGPAWPAIADLGHPWPAVVGQHGHGQPFEAMARHGRAAGRGQHWLTASKCRPWPTSNGRPLARQLAGQWPANGPAIGGPLAGWLVLVGFGLVLVVLDWFGRSWLVLVGFGLFLDWFGRFWEVSSRLL